MLVKSFEGQSMRDAMKKVKREFGSDAIILSTDEKMMNDNKEKFYEVRAAAAETRNSQGERNAFNYEGTNLESVNKQIGEISRKLSNYFDSFASKTQIVSLEREVKDLKLLCMELLQARTDFGQESLPEVLRRIFNYLAIAGVDKHYLSELIQQLKTMPVGDETKANPAVLFDHYLPDAIQWFAKKIRISHILPEASKFHSFVGASGAGKSSVLTKIAAHFLKQKKKILIMTFDTQGLASHEQLRVYAKILNIPILNVYGVDELRKGFAESANYDLVLIDNSGCFPYQEKDIQSLRDISTNISPIDFHVVLSLTEKQSQMDSTIRKCSSLGINSLIFTKLDEAQCWGEMFNLGHKWSLPLSYFSSGPRIPDDFENATRERLIEKLFSF